MKVLSVRQPWAWALIYGGKDIENRFWSTKYRGPIAIHASKGMTKKEYNEALEYINKIVNIGNRKIFLEFGKIIGVVDLVDVVEESDSPWFMGSKIGGKKNYGWVVKKARTVLPVEHKGSLGLRDLKGVELVDLSVAWGRHVCGASSNLGSSIQT